MSSINPLYEKKVKCIFCSNEFTTLRLRARFAKSLEVEEDFCTIYEDESLSPYLYYVSVCPKCGFSYTDQFTPYFRDDIRKEVAAAIQGKWVPQDFSSERTYEQAIITYKLAVHSAIVKKEKHIVLAGLLIRLGWLYRKLKDSVQEQRFMRLAVKEYIESYSNGDYENTDMTEIRIGYLIGELNRRLENYDESLRYFSEVISKQRTSTEQSIISRAREQYQVVREIVQKEKESE